MKRYLCFPVLVGWLLTAVRGQNVPSDPMPTNGPPVHLDTSVILRAPPHQKVWRVLGSRFRDGGLLAGVVMADHPLRAIDVLAPMPIGGDYRDISLDPLPTVPHGFVLFWISF